jgi:hypothetical protein
MHYSAHPPTQRMGTPRSMARSAWLTMGIIELILMVPWSARADDSGSRCGDTPPDFVSECPDTTPNNPSKQGQWGCTFNMDSRAVHMALLRGRGDTHSYILYWPESTNGISGRVWKWSPGDLVGPPIQNLVKIPTPQTEPASIFCSGHSFLPDGRLLVTGGTDRANDDGTSGLTIFDQRLPATSAGGFASDPTRQMEFPRWYPTNTALPDGKVIISAGVAYDAAIAFGGFDGTTIQGNTGVFGANSASPYFSATLASGSASPGARTLYAGADLGTSPVAGPCPSPDNRYIMLLQGGKDGASVKSDLWGLRWNRDLDEYTWSPITPAVQGPAPGALERHTATLDPFHHAVYFFGGKGPGGASNALYRLGNINSNSDCSSVPEWQTIATNTPPSGRYGHNAMYDMPHRRILIFGGRQSSPAQDLNEVWMLTDLNQPTLKWQKLSVLPSPDGRPNGRMGACAVLDTSLARLTAHHRIFVFGGYSGDPLVPISDTLWVGNIDDTTSVS